MITIYHYWLEWAKYQYLIELKEMEVWMNKDAIYPKLTTNNIIDIGAIFQINILLMAPMFSVFLGKC